MDPNPLLNTNALSPTQPRTPPLTPTRIRKLACPPHPPRQPIHLPPIVTLLHCMKSVILEEEEVVVVVVEVEEEEQEVVGLVWHKVNTIFWSTQPTHNYPSP